MGPEKVLEALRYSLGGELGLCAAGLAGDGGMPNAEHIIMQPGAHVLSDGARA